MLQVDVLIDETYAYDPTLYDFAAFLDTYEITDNSTANTTYPFLRNAAVFRSVDSFKLLYPWSDDSFKLLYTCCLPA